MGHKAEFDKVIFTPDLLEIYFPSAFEHNQYSLYI